MIASYLLCKVRKLQQVFHSLAPYSCSWLLIKREGFLSSTKSCVISKVVALLLSSAWSPVPPNKLAACNMRPRSFWNLITFHVARWMSLPARSTIYYPFINSLATPPSPHLYRVTYFSKVPCTWLPRSFCGGNHCTQWMFSKSVSLIQTIPNNYILCYFKLIILKGIPSKGYSHMSKRNKIYY